MYWNEHHKLEQCIWSSPGYLMEPTLPKSTSTLSDFSIIWFYFLAQSNRFVTHIYRYIVLIYLCTNVYTYVRLCVAIVALVIHHTQMVLCCCVQLQEMRNSVQDHVTSCDCLFCCASRRSALDEHFDRPRCVQIFLEYAGLDLLMMFI